MSAGIAKLQRRQTAIDSLLCIGLDSNLARLPEQFRTQPEPQYRFNRWIIDQTHSYAAAYKINTAFYEARGAQGWSELSQTVEYLRQNHPDIVLIADAKRADIGSTSEAYAQAFFDTLGFDAITLHPYLGKEALTPFLERSDKVSIILCRTSNPGAGELQDRTEQDEPLWQTVARKVSSEWNEHHNCMLVVGATYPSELAQVRQIVGEMPLLIPGIGAQGGDLSAVLSAGLTTTGKGLLISASRSIIFDKNPSDSATKLRKEITALRDAQSAA